jgi:hypothetical protein
MWALRIMGLFALGGRLRGDVLAAPERYTIRCVFPGPGSACYLCKTFWFLCAKGACA